MCKKMRLKRGGDKSLRQAATVHWARSELSEEDKRAPMMCSVMGCFMCTQEAVWIASSVKTTYCSNTLHISISLLFICLLFWFLMKSHTNRPKCWQHRLQGHKANPLRAPFRGKLTGCSHTHFHCVAAWANCLQISEENTAVS